jgi:uncharacterized membrane protein
MEIEKLLSGMLVLHIAGGTIALISGLVAMFTLKGSKIHRLAGKIYFWAMTAVFIGALFTAIGHHKDFLLMVAFFSYYMTVRGYRILSLKKLHQGQKAIALDWIITSVSGLFLLALICWGGWGIFNGVNIGIVAIAFGTLGMTFLISDVRSFISPPKEKMHWWYGHISSMGGSYISAVTAFIVVNIQLPQFQWVLWILPGIIGGIIIGRTIKKYKLKFGGS